ncbi:zf-HC2 domain-containing protein [Agromyces archimandritae]|uniref:Alpha-ketoglutarate decarboxylase n=1 Tax=Agromyces archimandritae TaxID=2781962 RepID=A0A975FN46_9MICO|nr:zf-HC2 domain-containing protein [Agromyces archimandritae]QTX05215.1 alpha-ketoglutarate decarboxylase [Agromyces archimandritae]
MTDCGCDKARAELEELLHDELCSEDAADVREHMAGCAECRNEFRVGMVLTEVVQRACRESAPDELRSVVLTRIREIQAVHTAPRAVVD